MRLNATVEISVEEIYDQMNIDDKEEMFDLIFQDHYERAKAWAEEWID